MAAQKAAKKSAAPAPAATSTKNTSTSQATKSAAQEAKSAKAAKTAAPPHAKAPTKAAVSKRAPAPAKRPAAQDEATAAPTGVPTVKGTTKDGISYTKDFDVKFLTAQRAALLEHRAELVGQARRLEDEANSLIEEQEMGDVEFGDEGGEGDTMVVERERDLALSAQARQMVEDIDAALGRLAEGTYGYSLQSWKPIPRERLEAIPWATALVEEKVGGLGRR